MKEVVVKVSASTPAAQLAGSLKAKYNALREDERIIVRCIGAIPVNQSVKAFAILNQFLAKEGYVCYFCPSMVYSSEILRGKTTTENITVTVFSLHFNRM